LTLLILGRARGSTIQAGCEPDEGPDPGQRLDQIFI
jgi:hypothetical protein